MLRGAARTSSERTSDHWFYYPPPQLPLIEFPGHQTYLGRVILGARRVLFTLGFAVAFLSATGGTRNYALKPNAWLVLHAGQTRVVELALDELQMLSPTNQVLACPGLNCADSVKTEVRRLRAMTSADWRLVFYEQGVRRDEFTRCILTPDVLVRVAEESSVTGLFGSLNVAKVQPVSNLPGCWKITAKDPDGALELAATLRNRPRQPPHATR